MKKHVIIILLSLLSFSGCDFIPVPPLPNANFPYPITIEFYSPTRRLVARFTVPAGNYPKGVIKSGKLNFGVPEDIKEIIFKNENSEIDNPPKHSISYYVDYVDPKPTHIRKIDYNEDSYSSSTVIHYLKDDDDPDIRNISEIGYIVTLDE